MQVWGFVTLAPLFSCEFCSIFKNTIFYRTPLVAAFEDWTFKVAQRSNCVWLIYILCKPISRVKECWIIITGQWSLFAGLQFDANIRSNYLLVLMCLVNRERPGWRKIRYTNISDRFFTKLCEVLWKLIWWLIGILVIPNLHLVK